MNFLNNTSINQLLFPYSTNTFEHKAYFICAYIRTGEGVRLMRRLIMECTHIAFFRNIPFRVIIHNDASIRFQTIQIVVRKVFLFVPPVIFPIRQIPPRHIKTVGGIQERTPGCRLRFYPFRTKDREVFSLPLSEEINACRFH